MHHPTVSEHPFHRHFDKGRVLSALGNGSLESVAAGTTRRARRPDLAPRRVTTSVGTVRCLGDGIVEVFAVHDHPLDMREAHEVCSAIVQVARGRRAAVLVDARGCGGITAEARCVLTAGERHRALAVALVADLNVVSAWGVLLAHFNRSRTPTRLFASERTALEWLREFLNAPR